MTPWPDTAGADPPGHLHGVGMWLLGRHERLARLADRIVGVIRDGDDDPILDLDHLAAVICSTAEHESAWERYEHLSPPPAEDRDWDAWQDGGPQPDDTMRGLAGWMPMSSGEKASLRILATLAPTVRAPFHVPDLSSLDDEGRRLLADWCLAVQAW